MAIGVFDIGDGEPVGGYPDPCADWDNPIHHFVNYSIGHGLFGDDGTWNPSPVSIKNWLGQLIYSKNQSRTGEYGEYHLVGDMRRLRNGGPQNDFIDGSGQGEHRYIVRWCPLHCHCPTTNSYYETFVRGWVVMSASLDSTSLSSGCSGRSSVSCLGRVRYTGAANAIAVLDYSGDVVECSGGSYTLGVNGDGPVAEVNVPINGNSTTIGPKRSYVDPIDGQGNMMVYGCADGVSMTIGGVVSMLGTIENGAVRAFAQVATSFGAIGDKGRLVAAFTGNPEEICGQGLLDSIDMDRITLLEDIASEYDDPTELAAILELVDPLPSIVEIEYVAQLLNDDEQRLQFAAAIDQQVFQLGVFGNNENFDDPGYSRWRYEHATQSWVRVE